jgi:hypothetical protein
MSLWLSGLALRTFDYALAAAEAFLDAAGMAAATGVLATGIPDGTSISVSRCALVRTVEQRDRLNTLLRRLKSSLRSLRAVALNHRGTWAEGDEVQADTTSTFSSVLPSLTELAALRHLHLVCCVIMGAVDVSHLLAALAHLSGLTGLELNSNHISGGSRVVLGALAHLPELAALSLVDNICQGGHQLGQLAAAPALTRLYLAGDEFADHSHEDVMYHIAELAALREFTLSGVGFDSRDVHALSQACSALHELPSCRVLGTRVA